MSFTATDAAHLRKVIDRLEKLLGKMASTASGKSAKRSQAASTTKARATAKKTRRSGKELVAFRKMLKAERKRGVPVAALAKKHKISTAYVYSL